MNWWIILILIWVACGIAGRIISIKYYGHVLPLFLDCHEEGEYEKLIDDIFCIPTGAVFLIIALYKLKH